MPSTPPARPATAATLSRLRAALGRVIRGKPDAIELLLAGVLSGGHVLIEDVPGVGKTTLAKAFARAFELDFARVQFTPDLLPSDILGTHTLDPRASKGSPSLHNLRSPREQDAARGVKHSG